MSWESSPMVGHLAVLAALVTAQAAHAQLPSAGYEPPTFNDGKTHYEKSEQSFGRFTVVRYVEDCRAVPMLDFGCWLTKEAQLEWYDSSGRIGFSFVDNGMSIRFRVQGKSADGQTICLMQDVLVGYDPKPSTVENWQRVQPFISQQLRGCATIAPANLNRALAEARDSDANYVSAANAWKSVSVELFGSNGVRCIAERPVKPRTIPPRSECVKYSKP